MSSMLFGFKGFKLREKLEVIPKFSIEFTTN